jgi:rubredoxin
MLWIARTRDGVTHACAKPDRTVWPLPNPERGTLTACGMFVYDGQSPEPAPPQIGRTAPYVGLFRGLPCEVKCGRCKATRRLFRMDDGRDERGAEIAA